MVEPHNDNPLIPFRAAEQDAHFHLQMLHLGSFPLLVLVAAVLGLLLLVSGPLYLVGRWRGWWG